jgi:hypothetical protein
MTDTYLDDERVQDWRDRRRPQRQVKASPPKLDIPAAMLNDVDEKISQWITAERTEFERVLIARGGRDAILPRVCGLYKEDAEYRPLDIVALNGSSFISKKDNPGPCPGPGWQLLASAGRTGSRGEKGDKGEPGAQGPRGVGTPGASITGWTIDAENYLAIPLMSDGKKGPPLELRGFFKQFLSDAR